MVAVDSPRAPGPTSSATILLVDDSQHSLALYRARLEKAGFTVLQATDPDDAVTLCKTHAGPIDLLVSDVLFPPKQLQLKKTPGAPSSGRNGLDLVKLVRELRSEIPVILMSAHSDGELRRVGLSKFPDIPLLRKPLDPDVLLGKVKEILTATRGA